jgi:glycosyltransferase involved in cell wall biosynthesis
MLTPKSQNGAEPTARVSFVVPVRNDAEGLRRCLASIRAQGDVEIVVVDNGSSDGSIDVARTFGAKVIELPGAPVSTLRNRGVAAAGGDVIAFVDADMQLGAGWLQIALRLLRQPGVAAVGAEYCAPPQPTWVQRLYDGLREPTRGVADVRWLPTGNMIVGRAVFDAVGGFDERLRTCEDWDFCIKLTELGYRLLADGALRSAHFGDPRTLRLLFRSELWRGRDNMRVSLRRVPALRDIPGILIPPLWLLCAAAVVIGGVAAPAFGALAFGPMLAGLTILLSFSLLRTIRIWRRIRQERGAMLPAAFVVAFTYDLARALALVVTVPHRRAEAARAFQWIRA